MGKTAARLVRKIKTAAYGAQIIDISDEYVEWLCFANAGMLNRGNLYCFDYAIRNLPSLAPIIEIGSFCGLSTNLLSYYKRRHGVSNPLITSDKWEFSGAHAGRTVGYSSIDHTDYRAFVKETYSRNIRMFSSEDLPYTVEMLSDDFFAAWRSSASVRDILGRSLQLGGPMSFCYIDGDHSYEYARRDFENCDEFLEGGGFVLFDDSSDGAPWEVCKVVAELRKSKRYELVIKNPNYLFRKK